MASPINTINVLGALSVLAGIILRLIVGKRRFDRRGTAGLQRFKSFWSALIMIFLESLGSAISVVLMLLGVLLLLLSHFA